jgi:hypothetical protein
MAIPSLLFSVLLAAALTLLGWHLGGRRPAGHRQQGAAGRPLFAII